MSAGPALTHRIAGEGPPVVLLNGGMMTASSWEPFASRLRASHRVLGFDFRGQLLSPGPVPADLSGHARDVVALLDAVGWESAHLVGASFGAEVAVELAASAPARVRSLALITAMDRETPEFRRGSDEMRAILAEVRAGGDRGRFYDALIGGVYSQRYLAAEAAAFAARRAQVDQLPAAWFEGVDGLLASLEGFDLGPRLRLVRSPTLVVNAALDQVMAPERSAALAAGLRAETVIHPLAGHALVAEDPDWLGGVVLSFLGRQEPVAAAREERTATSDPG
jgi:pimeloyl-ACP methyl ester carboxylesterase